MEIIVDCDHFTVELDGQVVRVRGEIDLAARPALEEALSRMKADTPVELDLAGVTFIDSRGLAGVLEVAKHRAGAKLGAVSPAVERLLELTGTHDLFSGRAHV